MTGGPSVSPRGAISPQAQPYRRIGPFGPDDLPKGLLANHRLAPGVWGQVRLEQGKIDFVWDDEQGGRQTLAAPAEIVVPPQVPHHLELTGAFRLSITFLR